MKKGRQARHRIPQNSCHFFGVFLASRVSNYSELIRVDRKLYGKQLFTWLSLVVSLMASYVLSFFPLDVLDEIWDLIESVSGGFLTYSLG